jgi:hypothetical protein
MGTYSPVNVSNPKPQTSAPNPLADAANLEAAADQAIAACGGDAREAVKALLIANEFLESEMERARFTRIRSRREARKVRHLFWISQIRW